MTAPGSQREPMTQSASSHVPDQFKKRARRRRAVGVHVADQIASGGELEAFDERAALADGSWKFQRADGREFRRHPLDHAERVVRAAVEHDDDLELAVSNCS